MVVVRYKQCCESALVSADPDPDFYLNMDPDPDPGSQTNRIHADPDPART
jgi:hypothetical protein